jgi:hypothetical protein
LRVTLAQGGRFSALLQDFACVLVDGLQHHEARLAVLPGPCHEQAMTN